jgi:peptidase M50-like protein
VPARGALTLFHVRGIPIGVDYSWFFVLFLVILWLSGFYKGVLGDPEDSIAPYVLALASAVAFFGSVLLHELGHALVAIRNGIGISDITLWMFGGVARLGRDRIPDRRRGPAGDARDRARLRRRRDRRRRQHHLPRRNAGP